jgi:hypothetical protein
MGQRVAELQPSVSNLQHEQAIDRTEWRAITGRYNCVSGGLDLMLFEKKTNGTNKERV